MKKKVGALQLTRETVTRLTTSKLQNAGGGATNYTICRCNITVVTCACTVGC